MYYFFFSLSLLSLTFSRRKTHQHWTMDDIFVCATNEPPFFVLWPLSQSLFTQNKSNKNNDTRKAWFPGADAWY